MVVVVVGAKLPNLNSISDYTNTSEQDLIVEACVF